MQQLRDEPRVAFEALPPVDQVAVAGPASHRYVRQDDPLWDRLHEGVLTTGLVRGALGIYEKTAFEKIGIPNSRVGHGELLKAYHHLRHQPALSSPDAAGSAAAAGYNAGAVVAYNAAKWDAGASQVVATRAHDVNQNNSCAAALPVAAATTQAAQTGAAPRLSKHARRRQKKQALMVATAALQQSEEGGAQGPGPGEGSWGVIEEQKLKKARALGSQGLLSMCCSWGKAQEAASLLQVAGAFPQSQLAEVGLCRLQQHLLPAAWGFSPGSLPPIGASPDALIWQSSLPGIPGSQPGSTSAPTARNGCATAEQQAPSPAIGPWDIDGLLARMQLAANGTATASSEASSVSSNNGTATAGSSSSTGTGRETGRWLIEVVEVKNTCPFGHSRRGGRLRTNEFMVADRGPRTAVPPEWVPQLQLHMLCAGTPSGLLVSRSATKGTRVFRMQRDDELLRFMLLVISRLWQQHVLPGRPPPADVYASWREHHDLMRRIGEVAREATLVTVIEDGHRLPGSDNRWFLD